MLSSVCKWGLHAKRSATPRPGSGLVVMPNPVSTAQVRAYDIRLFSSIPSGIGPSGFSVFGKGLAVHAAPSRRRSGPGYILRSWYLVICRRVREAVPRRLPFGRGVDYPSGGRTGLHHLGLVARRVKVWGRRARVSGGICLNWSQKGSGCSSRSSIFRPAWMVAVTIWPRVQIFEVSWTGVSGSVRSAAS